MKLCFFCDVFPHDRNIVPLFNATQLRAKTKTQMTLLRGLLYASGIIIVVNNLDCIQILIDKFAE